MNWKPCIDAICKPRRPKKESIRVWPLACGSCFWIGFHLWPRLTRYRTWKGPKGETRDGTNNASERAIGWWIKERYRSMRGDIGARERGTRQSPACLVWQLPQC